MCFDSSGNLYLTDFLTNALSKFDSGGNLMVASFGSGFNADPESCSIDAANNIYVGEADGSGKVLKFDASGNLLASFNPAVESRGTDWVDLASDQKTLYYTSEGSSIKRFDVSTDSQLPDFATGLPAPCYALRVRSNGEVLVACSTVVERLDSSGTVIQTYTGLGTGDLFALNLAPDGTSFWTGDLNSGQIYHVDIATGNVISSFNANFNTALGGLAVVGELRAAQPTITASGQSVTATEGALFAGQVASFTDPNRAASAGDYTASIDWGDGSTPTTGTIGGSGGSFTVSGGHSYGDEGSDTIVVTVTDTDNASVSATVTSAATIGDAALAASGVGPIPASPQSFDGAVAKFTDANTSSTTADFAATTIDWGDGSPNSTGTVGGSRGSYGVSGGHAYTTTGYFTIKTHIVDDGGRTADATTHVLIFGTAQGGNFVISYTKVAVGTSVNFWGAQWATNNPLLDTAPSAFKGFEDEPTTAKCGQSWSSDPGNSTPPPDGPLPTYMAVLASSSVSGPPRSTITGNIVNEVVVHTNPGYGPAPGARGTGTVVETVC